MKQPDRRRIVAWFTTLLLAESSSSETSHPASVVPSWLKDGRPTTRKDRRREMQMRGGSFLRTRFKHARSLQTLAEDNCEEDAQQNEEFLATIGLQCHCLHKDAGVLLMCIDDCSYCNDAQTVCGVQSAQALYDDETGLRTGIGGVFQYTTGFHATLAVENVGCLEQDGVITSCETCNVYVNGEICNSCELVACENGGQAERMDCANIEDGAVYDFCNEVIIEDDSVFTALSTNGFEECLPREVMETGKSSKSSKSSKKSGEKGSKKSSDIYEAKYSKSAKKAKSRRK